MKKIVVILLVFSLTLLFGCDDIDNSNFDSRLNDDYNNEPISGLEDDESSGELEDNESISELEDDEPSGELEDDESISELENIKKSKSNDKLDVLNIDKELYGALNYFDYVKFGKEYDDLSGFKLYDGKLRFIAQKDDKRIFYYDRKGYGKEYDLILSDKLINGELTFLAKKDNNWYVIQGGEKIRKHEKEPSSNFKELGGKLAYHVRTDGGLIYHGDNIYGKGYASVSSNFDLIDEEIAFQITVNGHSRVVYDGKILGEDFTHAKNPKNINGKLLYDVYDHEDKNYFFVYDGVVQNKYDRIFDPLEVDDVLAYKAWNNDKEIVVYGDKEFIYDSVDNLKVVDNKLFYEATLDDNTFYVFDFIKYGKDYDYISNPIFIDGKLAFFARDNEGSFYVYDNVEYGREYDGVTLGTFKIINGKEAYVAYNGLNQFIVYDGTVYGEEYNSIDNDFKEIKGKLTYRARKDGAARGKYILVFDGYEIGEEYETVSEFYEINNKLIFSVFDNDQFYIVYDGYKIGEDYDRVDFIKDVNKEIIKSDDSLYLKAQKDGEEFLLIEN